MRLLVDDDGMESEPEELSECGDWYNDDLQERMYISAVKEGNNPSDEDCVRYYTLLRGDCRLQQNQNQIYNQWSFCMTMHSAVVSKGVYDYLTCYSCDMSHGHLWSLVDICICIYYRNSGMAIYYT